MTVDGAIRAWRLRLRSLLHRQDVERDLDDELRYHVDLLVEQHLAAGMSAPAARARALKALGGVSQTKEACRDTWHVRQLDQLAQDVHVAWRTMRRTPGATLLMVTTLAIGIAATTAMFSVVNGVLLTPPYPEAERLFWVVERTPAGQMSAVSTLNYLDWKEQSSAFEALGSWGTGTVTLGNGGAPVPLRATFASAGYFRALSIGPELGRTFHDDEAQPGRDRVAVLSHQLWASAFGRARDIVGRTIRLRGDPYVVVGVMPAAASRGDWDWTEVWLPQTFEPANRTRDFRSFNVLGRLNRGVSPAAAHDEMTAIAARLSQAYPASNKDWSVMLLPHSEALVSATLRQSLWLLFGAVVVLLLIACVNLANILLARVLTRRHEATVRASLGGGRGRLLRQFATESVLLSLGSGVAGLAGAQALLVALRELLPAFSAANGALPPASAIVMDGRVVVFALAVSVLAGLLVAALPARAASHTNLASMLNERESRGELSSSMRRLLVAGQVALAFVLLASASMLLSTLRTLQNVNTGFDSRGVLTATLPIGQSRATGDGAERARYFERVLESISRVPGVESATLTSVLPMQGWGSELPCQRAGAVASTPAERPTCFFKMVSPSYAETLGLSLRRGRFLNATDDADHPRAAVINETLAAKFFGSRDPIGARLKVPELVSTGRARLGGDIEWEVVGVVADELVSALKDRRESPGLYVTIAQSPARRVALAVRSHSLSAALARELRLAVASVDADQPLADVRTLESIAAASLGSERQRSLLVTAFAGVALLLAALGIYGTVAFSVVQRTRELGIRAAIGVSPRGLSAFVLRDGLLLTAGGIAAGIAAALVAWRALGSVVAGLNGGSLVDFAVPAALLLIVSAVACLVPARRAGSTDPLAALRWP